MWADDSLRSVLAILSRAKLYVHPCYIHDCIDSRVFPSVLLDELAHQGVGID